MKPGRSVDEIDKVILERQRQAWERHIVYGNKMSYEVCPTVPTKITIAKDGQHCIGLRKRKGIGKTEIALVGGATNARDEPDPSVIVGLPRIEIMGIIDAEAQGPLLPGGQNIELGARIENVEIATKSGNTAGSGEGTGARR